MAASSQETTGDGDCATRTVAQEWLSRASLKYRNATGVAEQWRISHGNVWVFHRPYTLEEGNATENGYVPAPRSM